MYNRYVGNTGKFYRVEDMEPVRQVPPQWEPVPPREPPPPPGPLWAPAHLPLSPPEPVWTPPHYPPPPPEPEPAWEPPHYAPPEPMPVPPPLPKEEGSWFDLGSLFHVPGSLRETLRDKLPERLDLGDILLVLVLIYLFLEGDDDDMLIILGVLVVTWLWPLIWREEDA